MVKVFKIISAIALCIAVAAFAPQAKADPTPSGLLTFNCSPCTGSVSGGTTGPWVGSGIDTTLTFASSPNGGDEVTGTFVLAFDTGAGTISLSDTDADFNLSGTIVSITPSFNSTLNEETLNLVTNLNGFGSGGPVVFILGVSALGGAGSVESASISVLTPEPATLLLLGTGLLGLGGALRRRFQS